MVHLLILVLYKLFVCLLIFLPYFLLSLFSSFVISCSLLIYFLTHLLSDLTTFSRIDAVRFQAGDHRRSEPGSRYRFSHFCTGHRRLSRYFTMWCHFPLPPPKKIVPFPWGISAHSSWAHPTRPSKRRVDRLSDFRMAYKRDQHTDTPQYSVCSNGPLSLYIAVVHPNNSCIDVWRRLIGRSSIMLDWFMLTRRTYWCTVGDILPCHCTVCCLTIILLVITGPITHSLGEPD